MATDKPFVLQVVFWMVVLTFLLVGFALHTRHRLRLRYDVKLSELSEGLKSLNESEPKR